MKKYYFILFIFISTFSYGQVSELAIENKETSIDTQISGLRMYPNPVANGIVTITSFTNSIKRIQIFDLLGKQVLFTTLKGKQLNVSQLNSGIYILKIGEKDKISTRKLVVK